MFFDFQTKTAVSKIFVCLLGLKFHDMGRQTQRKPENTVYLSTFTIFLWCPTVMLTPLLCIQIVLCYLSDSSTQKYCILVML